MPKVISFHYTLQDKNGEVIDSSREGDALPFLEGVKQIVPGLETELLKMKAGEKRKFTVPFQQGYGPHHPQLVQKVPRKDMPAGEIEVGDQFQAGQGKELIVVTVTAIDATEVTLDGNH